MTVLAAGALLAAWATRRMATPPGIALAIAAFAAIGVGVGAAGTSLLALLAAGVDHDDRRLHRHHRGRWPAARFVLPGAVAGGRRRRRRRRVDARRRRVAGVEPAATPGEAAPRAGFEAALREIWADRRARRFTIFVVVSMLAYSAQELIIEPFAGLLFGFTPGQSTSLAALQHGGGLVGMVSVGVFGSLFGRRDGWLRSWIVGGCIASAVALGGLACAALAAPHWPLQPTVFVLGVANGVFAVAAVGSMMGLAGGGGPGREGVRMGVWGAAQATAFAVGGFAGAAGVDIGRSLFGSTPSAFVAVFIVEAGLFIAAAIVAVRVDAAPHPTSVPMLAEGYVL